MLSILIPTYNYNAYSLVLKLSQQCNICAINYEIIVLDDCSTQFIKDNYSIKTINYCTYIVLEKNIGRSAIRNKLAYYAKYNSLLFLDADTIPFSNNFIEQYIKTTNSVVNGGVICTKNNPKKPYKLRWLFTKYRESNALCSSNFLIKKAVFKKHFFDESIKTYGYEDVLFFDNLKKKNINIIKINNPVIHASNDDASTFLKKTELAINNLINLIKTNKLNKENFKVSLLFNKLEKLKLTGLITQLFELSKPLLIKNFNSSHPSLFLFDFYRLGYFCTLIKNKK